MKEKTIIIIEFFLKLGFDIDFYSTIRNQKNYKKFKSKRFFIVFDGCPKKTRYSRKFINDTLSF